MSFPQACCTQPPVSSDYSPKGSKGRIGDLDVYVVGDPKAETALFAYYDIFGFHNNTFQFCDRLAEHGFRVFLPDFFRGKPWSLNDYPPKKVEDLKQWAFIEHTWKNKIKRDSLNILEHLKKTSDIRKLGAFGFCWGGRIVFDALLDEDSIFQCGAVLHPAGLTEDDFKNIKLPVIAILSKEESGLLPFGVHLDSKHSSCKDYTDQTHGFCAARGDYTVKAISERATEANKEVASFFVSNLL